jgi:uncharacterized membrane protein YgaE (UPF0421/DUF939 family)
MIVASSYGQAVVTPIQAAVSAILVIAFGPATSGSVRMIDVAVGVAVAFMFNQALILEQRCRAKNNRSKSAVRPAVVVPSPGPRVQARAVHH